MKVKSHPAYIKGIKGFGLEWSSKYIAWEGVNLYPHRTLNIPLRMYDLKREDEG